MISDRVGAFLLMLTFFAKAAVVTASVAQSGTPHAKDTVRRGEGTRECAEELQGRPPSATAWAECIRKLQDDPSLLAELLTNL